MPNVHVVIITYNRLSKLKHALECYEKQTKSFSSLIVVDNNSTDGTKDYLRKWQDEPALFEKHVICLPNNVGGSGGFYEGEKFAQTLHPDWVFVSDDDAYPEADLMEKFYDFQGLHKEEKIAVVCSEVKHLDGSLILGCRKRVRIEEDQFITREVPKEEYQKDYFECNSVSYVGAFLSANALRKVGLINRDFFIYQDDEEHSMRLSKYGKMYCVPDITVVHDSVPVNQMKSIEIQKILWKEYYAYRNYLYMLLTHCKSVGKAEVIRTLKGIKSHRISSMSAINKMQLEGVYDAIRGKLGIHSIYRPGLIISDDNISSLPYPKIQWEIVYWILRIQNTFIKDS